ncbi:glycosyltransferase [Kineococcus rubinsiae]|uniref:glycosyltransferase n=1 Tax=Kineococcus rubinsiae TaxID=2609562 RepID=UPI0014305C59|nr:glycosyltransferase [Kineococcus rubinsiae]NIZ91109.1 glycosyltransferase [Kineococcus rubinsiae]
MRGSGPAGQVSVFESVWELADNPFAGLWVDALRAAGARVRTPSVAKLVLTRRAWLHLQWPEWSLTGPAGPVRGLLRLLLTTTTARLAGHRVLLTVHNARGHHGGHPRLERLMWNCLSALATHVHTFTAAGAREFRELHPTRRYVDVVVPHGNYHPVTGPVPDRAAARGELDLEPADEVLLTFGKLKAYKGLDALLAAFAGDRSPRRRLLLCGQPADEEARTLLTDTALDPRTRVQPRFLTQEELTTAVAAADLVVLPYARITNSGSALMALSIGRPVLLPRTPVFEELRDATGHAWVHLYDGELSAGALSAALAAAPTQGSPDLDWCSWETVAEHLRTLLNASTGH